VDYFRAGDGVLRRQWSQKINDLGVCFSGEYAVIREQAAAASMWLSKFQESHFWNRAVSTSFCPPRLSNEVIRSKSNEAAEILAYSVYANRQRRTIDSLTPASPLELSPRENSGLRTDRKKQLF
jgi:hypothetical protein